MVEISSYMFRAKKDVEAKGGKITHEYTLTKGFEYVLKGNAYPC